MDNVEYSNKLADLIGNGDYSKVKKKHSEDGKKAVTNPL